MIIDAYTIYKPRKRQETCPKFESNKLYLEPETREKYQNTVAEKISKINEEQQTGPQQKWNTLKEIVLETANEIIPKPKPKNTHGHKYNEEVEKLSTEQKELRLKINQCRDTAKMAQLKFQRNNLMRELTAKLKEIETKEIETKIEEINKAKDCRRTFQAIKMLNRKPSENMFIHDKDGKNVTSPDQVYKIVHNHFETVFNKPNIKKIEPFNEGETSLQNNISLEEVEKNINILNNNRAPGFDGMQAELLKYAPTEAKMMIRDILNECFEQKVDIELGRGILNALPKPNKPKGPPKNLRPVILLPTIRKTVSNIARTRIKEKVDNYLSPSQSAFREKRSTSDAVWAHRWLVARIERYQEKIYITGIDMSSAFDTIHRDKLLNTLSNIVDRDELQMLQLLLAQTTLEIKMKNTNPIPFTSNVGSPQGDGISGLLFNIYFESSLKKMRNKLKYDNNQTWSEHSYSKSSSSKIPFNEIIYADDFDHITDDLIEKKHFDNIVKDTLLEDNLLVNEDKTEHTTLQRKTNMADTEEKWRHVKKLGSKLGLQEDLTNRKILATTSLQKLNNLWFEKTKISSALKVKVYKAIVKSILLYNCGTWGMTKTDEESLNAFHRQQLRRVLNVVYPAVIKNKKLYEMTNEKPIILDVIAARWRLFGHVHSQTELFQFELFK